MSEPKPFASLSPSLLARKGSARPAMRPQIQPLHHYHDALARQPMEDDLGWNDMGHDEPVEQAESVPVSAPVPEVVRQQEAIAERIAEPARVVAPVVAATPEVAAEPVAKAVLSPMPARAGAKSAATSRSRQSALSSGRRAAFTLRVDAERHLKLRLACTLRGRSAQQIVTEALDMLLDGLPEVSSLAAQVAVKR